jgi:alpha-galactosidase
MKFLCSSSHLNSCEGADMGSRGASARSVSVRAAMSFVPLFIAALSITIPAAGTGLPTSGLAASPPMGWNSWDAYGFGIDESAFRANATVLAQLSSYGWKYAVIDEGWYMKDPAGADVGSREYQLDRNGLLIPALNRFPSAAKAAGLRPLADWIHHHGLKLGIHIVRGIPRQAVRENLPIADSRFRAADAADTADTCPWDDGNFGILDGEAGQAYYDSMFKLYAAWKVDFVKVDCIANRPYRASEIRQIAAAIQHAGRPMVLSLSPGPVELSHAAEVGRYAQLWRISNDIWDGWTFAHDKPGDDFPTGIVSAFEDLARWAPYARAGHWPDADMLPFGRLGPHPGWGDARASRLTRDEQRTQFVLWAVARSPLILGANLTQLDEFTRSLITNRRLIEINQGAWTSRPLTNPPAGYEGVRVWISSKSGTHTGDTIVALFNLESQPKTIRADWEGLGLGSASRTVLDIQSGERIGTVTAVDVQLPAHASAVYQLH